MKKLLKPKRKKYHVIMDPRDNSVVLPPDVFCRLGGMEKCHTVYVFKIAGTESDFAFITNPEFDFDTQVCDVQYNTKTKNVGFETLTPSVAMMFARWHLPLDAPQKIGVVEQTTAFDFGSFWEFDPDASEPA